MNFLAKVTITSGILLAGTSFNIVNVNAAVISGFGSPLTAIPGGTVIDFETATLGDFSSLNFGNVTITGVDAPFTITGPTAPANQFNTSGKSLTNGQDFVPKQFRFDFSTPVNAFAFNFGQAYQPWLLSAFNSGGSLLDSAVSSYSTNQGEYFGLSAPGISYATLVLQTNINWVYIDNFTSTNVSNTQQVPEPFTVIGTLIGGTAAIRMRKKLKSADRV